MRAFALAAALLFAGPAVSAAPPQPATPPLRCAGAATQGGVMVCLGWPGATIVVDGVERGKVDAKGWFVVGFDRDGAAKSVVETRLGKSFARQEIAVAPRQFSIQRVDGLPEQTVNPTDPAVLKKIQRDVAVKNAAFGSRADIEGWLDGFRWPISGIMSGPWGNQRVLNGEPRTPHYGIDIAAPQGTQIRAPASGVVALAEPDMHFEGGLVLVDHGQGLITMYLHMSKLQVKVGDRLKAGDPIGLVGMKGRATGPHLCWRMKWRDRYVDPSLAVKGLNDARVAFGAAPTDPGPAPTGFAQWAGR